RSGVLDDVALLEEDLLQGEAPFLLAPGEELQVHREVEELLALGVLHDRLRGRILLQREALRVPADRLCFLLQRRDQAGEGSSFLAKLFRGLVVLIGGHGRTLRTRGAAAVRGRAAGT